jgi:phosphate transport system substrate-binding protein
VEDVQRAIRTELPSVNISTFRRRALPVVIAGSLVLAACSGDDDDDTATTEAPTPTADSSATDATTTPAETDGTTEPAGTSGTTDGGSGGTAAPMEPVSGTLIGAGASSQAAAMQGWQAGFQEANPDATVEYDPVGSGGGRETFLAGGSSFAGSDAYLDEEEMAAATERCGDMGAINLPHYISPIAIAYNLPDVDTLNLTPATLAGIFAGEITNWNDEALATDNPDVELPDLNINPVHRSDESGTTENFTEYLEAVAGDVWTHGPVESWPNIGGEGAQGTSGVVAAIGAGEGSIGYADASQVVDLGTAAIQVGDEFVEYSPEAAARIVDVSARVEGRGEYDFAYDLVRDTTESGVYPIALVSYHIVCLQYEDQATADLVKAFMSYVGSEAGQAAAAEAAGSAPLSPELSAELRTAIEQITVG